MGQALYSLFSGRLPSDVVVDWENVEANAANTTLLAEVKSFLAGANSQVNILENYSGNGQHIRDAMSNPKDAARQVQCFRACLPNIRTIKTFYSTSKQLEELSTKVITKLGSAATGQGADGLAGQQALLKSLGELLCFSLSFDQKKMLRPDIQNDFSFFRRSLGKHASEPGIPVTDIEANNVSMFVAQAMPMMHCLKTSLSSLARQSTATTNLLAQVCNVCCATLIRRKDGSVSMSEETAKFVVNAMTMAMVLYDECSLSGVFRRGSAVDARRAITQIKTFPPETQNALLNVLQYSTKTFKSAPDNVKRMIK